jgi:exodeoxyribonuclease VII small subunit
MGTTLSRANDSTSVDRQAGVGYCLASTEGNTMARKKSFQFEQALHELEQLVTRMEGGQLSLEASLAAFEQGIALTRECQQALKQAEQKVQLLMEKNGQVIMTDFHDDEENA